MIVHCVVPENIHTPPPPPLHPPTEGIGNPWRRGGSQRPKTLKQRMKLNWNFQRGGGGGHSWQVPSIGGGGGGYGYFLEPHIG